MHGDPILVFDISLPLLVFCILSKNKRILNVKGFNFIAISTLYDRIFLRIQVYVTYNYPSERLILPEETILPANKY